MNKKDILIIISVILLLAVGGTIFYIILLRSSHENKNGVNILTDKKEYSPGDTLKVKIENNSGEMICFSSCYPYYLQRKNADWENYSYDDCNKENIADKCIDPQSVKAFELTIPKIQEGAHRLMIGACVGCRLEESFRADENLFSNDFVVK